MKKSFDAHIYYACWATRVLMLRVPAKCVDLKRAKKYCTKNTFKIVENGADAIFCFNCRQEAGDGWWDEDGETKQLITLRDDILGGDYRCLYLAWLARKHDDNYREEDDNVEPPIPARLRNLTEPLEMFVKFMCLEDADLEEAAKKSGDDEPKPPTAKELKEWIAALPEKVKHDTLFSLLQGDELPQTVHRGLLNRFLKDRKKAKSPKAIPTKPVNKPCRKKPSKKP